MLRINQVMHMEASFIARFFVPIKPQYLDDRCGEDRDTAVFCQISQAGGQMQSGSETLG
jgi:hypothetical protein